MRRSADETGMSRGLFYKGVALGATVSIVLLGAQAAFAGTGIGGVFNLGRTNTVGATTTLTGATGAAQLQVTNKGTGTSATGVSITVDPRRAPLRVSSKVVVPNLNSNFLQGKRAADFLGVTATAANAAQLGGKPASSYLLTTGTAANAAKLGGVAANEYVRGCPLYGGAGQPLTGGSVAARAVINGFYADATLSAAAVTGAWTCSGGPILVERTGLGMYCVVVDPTVTMSVDGETYAGLPQVSDRVAPLVTLTTYVRTATVNWTPCGGTTGLPGETQYYGFFVEVRNLATGLNDDAIFTFALL